MKILLLTSIVLLASLLGTTAFADGTHGVKVTVINETGKKLEILAYNSKDSSMSVPHKVYYSAAGGTRIVKAHGQGKGNLRMTILHGGKTNTKCLSSEGKIIKASGDKWEDGTTVRVTSCYNTDEQGY